jgi:hypothetical protein
MVDWSYLVVVVVVDFDEFVFLYYTRRKQGDKDNELKFELRGKYLLDIIGRHSLVFDRREFGHNEQRR